MRAETPGERNPSLVIGQTVLRLVSLGQEGEHGLGG